jgi:hypothetical protein
MPRRRHDDLRLARESTTFVRNELKSFSFRAHRTNDPTRKIEKVGPFECDELEKHCRVSANCYPTKVPALYTMAMEKFNKDISSKWDIAPVHGG